LTLTYNDAAIRLLGPDHPGAFGNGPDSLTARWRSIRTDLERVRSERCVVHTDEMILTPIIDGDAVVAIAGSAVAVDENRLLTATKDHASLLVVDDDPIMRMFLTNALADDWTVRDASGGTSALELIAAERPDLVISDLRMPDGDGLGLVTALRRDPATATLPVILLTGFADANDRTSGIEAGADDYLVKPITPSELRARVRHQLALGRIREEESRKAKHAKDDFLATIGHELRNPLSTASTMAQALMLRSPGTDLELMNRALRHLSSLVDDLVESSRLSRKKITIDPVVRELAMLVDRAVEIVTPAFDERNIRMLLSVPRVGFKVDADVDRLTRAIANILLNAAQHSSAKQDVVVHATRVGDRIHLRIADQGVGISPERIANVFEAFQGDRAAGGLGLGLSIARNIVELHHGSLELASGGEGQGTRCTFDLPAATGVAVAAADVTPRKIGHRLLLVEDNDDAARALKRALEQLGYEVALAHNAPIALNLARSFKPDVALLDLGLPVMDGWELARRLRHAEADLPIVAVTARDQAADKERSAELGFVDHLVKPIDLNRLEKIVSSLDAGARRPIS
jgi:DNA-binding response OmpR family regulator/anti-sigma regulatory factor (Ser/Thr protein kinase)